jgi:hypothetical protein
MRGITTSSMGKLYKHGEKRYTGGRGREEKRRVREER